MTAPPLDHIQREIAEELRNIQGHAKLTGGPGVGKSTVLRTLHYPLIAPTNKAAAVVNGITVHKFLGLQLKRFGGEERLVPTKDTKPFYRKVIIDESSCLDTSLLENYILPNLPNAIFVGDEAQLSPVGESSIPFMDIPGPHFHLDKVYRFGDEILDISHQFRKAIMDQDFHEDIHIPDDWVSDGRADGEIAIAWTNKAVRSWQEDCDWYVGQAVRVGSFHQRRQLPTEMETTITRIGDLDEYHGLPYREIHLEGVEGWVAVCTEPEALQQELKKLAGNWPKFWGLKDFFCDLRQGVSITAHKSQGSTYDNIFVDFRDIFSNRNTLEAHRCAYVAITRARHKVRCLI